MPRAHDAAPGQAEAEVDWEQEPPSPCLAEAGEGARDVDKSGRAQGVCEDVGDADPQRLRCSLGNDSPTPDVDGVRGCEEGTRSGEWGLAAGARGRGGGGGGRGGAGDGAQASLFARMLDNVVVEVGGT